MDVWKLHVTGKLFHSGLPNQAINALELGIEALKVIQTRFHEDFPAHPKEFLYNFATPPTMKPTQRSCVIYHNKAFSAIVLNAFYCWSAIHSPLHVLLDPGGGINQIPGKCTISGDCGSVLYF